jgi:ANTAR domain-containing protein
MSADGSRRPDGGPDEVVVRKVDHGWVVGDENVSDLTSAMVLADLFAADHATGHDTRRTVADAQTAPAVRNTAARNTAVRNTAVRNTAGRNHGKEVDEAARLAVTVTQLEHALASRVRVEQAIGVLAERHRLRPREAFDLLRGAARSQGRRVTEIAQDVVASAANPLLRLPAELARTLPEPRLRERSLRRGRRAEQF